ncbi:MAG TPA: peptidylprolyl isomerase [Longilinea sp.]|nr:peptidylprolyl isomerase [Longilinea sp.]
MPQNPTQKVVNRKHLARVERERRQKKILLTATIIIAVIVIGVIGFGIVKEVVLKPYEAVAEVGSERISAQDFQTYTTLSRIDRLLTYNYDSYISQNTTDFMVMYQAYIEAQQIQSDLSADNASTFASTVLDNMMDNILIAQAAPDLGVSISDEQVEQELQTFFGYFPNGTPTPSNTQIIVNTPTVSNLQATLVGATVTPQPTATAEPTATLDPAVTPTETLAPTATGTSLPTFTVTPTLSGSATPTYTPTVYSEELFQTNITSYNDQLSTYNVSMDDYRNYMRTSLLRQAVFDAVTADIPTSAEQIWARHILVPSQEEALAIYDRLQNGEDWNALAAEVNAAGTDGYTAEDLGWFMRGQMDSAFEDAAFALQIGAISEPVQSSFGWHIIEVIGHDADMALTASQINIAEQSAFETWLQSLRDAGTYAKNDNWIDWVVSEPQVQAQTTN